MTVDKKLAFQKHVEDFYKKANQKLHALARLSDYIDPIKSEILMNSFITSQFNYCPLVWMFHDRATNSKLNRIHERALSFHFTLKLFTQGTIQSKYCFHNWPCKNYLQNQKVIYYKIYNKTQRCIRLFFLEFGLEGID